MIRDLEQTELPLAAALAAAAFRDDPGFSHLIPDDAKRRLRLPSLIEALLSVDLASGGRVRGAFDDGALVGVSATMPVGAKTPRVRDWLGRWRSLSWLVADPAAVLRCLAMIEAIESLRPADHDYLHLLAVHPVAQGRGVGGALVNDALKSGKPLYLETFTPENAAWYEKLGFKRRAEVVSPTRPTFWTFQR